MYQTWCDGEFPGTKVWYRKRRGTCQGHVGVKRKCWRVRGSGAEDLQSHFPRTTEALALFDIVSVTSRLASKNTLCRVHGPKVCKVAKQRGMVSVSRSGIRIPLRITLYAPPQEDCAEDEMGTLR